MPELRAGASRSAPTKEVAEPVDVRREQAEALDSAQVEHKPVLVAASDAPEDGGGPDAPRDWQLLPDTEISAAVLSNEHTFCTPDLAQALATVDRCVAVDAEADRFVRCAQDLISSVAMSANDALRSDDDIVRSSARRRKRILEACSKVRKSLALPKKQKRKNSACGVESA